MRKIFLDEMMTPPSRSLLGIYICVEKLENIGGKILYGVGVVLRINLGSGHLSDTFRTITMRGTASIWFMNDGPTRC